jgi:hypothetical protein
MTHERDSYSYSSSSSIRANGVLEWWSIGVVEYWSDGILRVLRTSSLT